MRLELWVFGKLIDSCVLCGSDNVFTNKCLLFNAVEQLKMKNAALIRNNDWEIFIVNKSKANE